MSDNIFDTEFAPPLDRVDGVAKVTGTAKFSAEYNLPNLAYGIMVGSTISKGTITSMDTKAAETSPGVLAVITHLNCPPVPGYKLKEGTKPDPTKGYKVFTDAFIRFNNQPIAIVVADTMERAYHAAALVKATYKKEDHRTNLVTQRKEGKPLEGANFADYTRGKAEAWKTAEVKIEAEYHMPIEVHNPMEMHSIVVQWEADDKIMVYEKSQALQATQGNIAQAFGLKPENIRVISKYLGGAFGSAFNTWPHSIAALIAAKKLYRPIKVMLSRDQMFTNVGYRPEAIQKMSLGATKDGKLTGISHDATAMTSAYQSFTEGIVNGSRSLYNCANVFTRYKVFPLDLGVPTWMRGPGETTGAYALECAMDELAYALNMDPLQLRIINYAETDLEDEKPYSSKFLKECYQLGADKFGWKDRNAKPASMKEGDWLVGYGVGSGIFSAWRGASKLGVKFTAEGQLILSSGVTDMGPGTATSMTNLAAETMGLNARNIKFELGDSNYPPGIFQGGSGTTSSLGTTVHNGIVTLKKKLADLVKENPVFHTETIHAAKFEDLVFEDGFIALSSDRSKKISYATAIKNAGLQQIDFVESSAGEDAKKNYSAFSYAVHFVK
ncbi:MAG: xanthine dehydrogenase family protein molybdopterin-binding subunit, partial [Bacteroidota bacterium]